MKLLFKATTYFQMTFYAGLMSIVGRYEIGGDSVEKNRMEISIAENRVNIARHHRTLTVSCLGFLESSPIFFCFAKCELYSFIK